jgi:hypothetical protein
VLRVLRVVGARTRWKLPAGGNFLSAKESYGWFDDIPEEGWQLMKLELVQPIQYMNP